MGWEFGSVPTPGAGSSIPAFAGAGQRGLLLATSRLRAFAIDSPSPHDPRRLRCSFLLLPLNRSILHRLPGKPLGVGRATSTRRAFPSANSESSAAGLSSKLKRFGEIRVLLLFK